MANLMRRALCMVSASMIAWSIAFTPASCQESGKLSAAELTAVLRSSEIKVKAKNISVIGTGPTVTVLAEQEANGSDRDLKIDAVLMAKALMDRSAGQVQAAKVLYSQSDKPGRFVLVDKKTIEGYDTGKLTPEQLLTSLLLVTVEANPSADQSVCEGPMVERRLLIWRRIEKLKEQGTGVQAFEALFK